MRSIRLSSSVCWPFDVYQLIRENECDPTMHPCGKGEKNNIHFHNRKGLGNEHQKNFSVVSTCEQKFQNKTQAHEDSCHMVYVNVAQQAMSSSLLLHIHFSTFTCKRSKYKSKIISKYSCDSKWIERNGNS